MKVYLPVGRHAAVERGFDHPFALHACEAAFADAGFHLFEGHRPGARVVAEQPAWLPLRHGVRPVAADVELPARAAAPGTPTRVELRLVPDEALRRREALFVPARWSGVLRRLLYALPPAALEGWRAAAVEDGLVLLGSADRDGPPLGVPLRRATERVYVPIGRAFLPRVPPELVAEAVGDQPGLLTFFVDAARPPFTLPESAFAPADRTFLARLAAAPAARAELPASPGAARVYFGAGAFPLWGRRYGGDGPEGGA